jgi:exonuclease III
MIVGDFNTPLLSIDRSTRQKNQKETAELNNTIKQKDLTGIYRVFHPAAATPYTFFSAAHGKFLQKRSYFRIQGKS